MTTPDLSVREITAADVESIIGYWMNATPEYLRSLGADPDKMPNYDQWVGIISAQLDQPYNEKQSYATIWLSDGEPVGHCNVNHIVFGEKADMHLHLWQPATRQKSMGATLVKLSVPYFFENLQLKSLFCMPYALNPAPNRVLEKAGFSFIREYVTVPGMINFEQPVKLWELRREDI